jgi:hypothetical protein
MSDETKDYVVTWNSVQVHKGACIVTARNETEAIALARAQSPKCRSTQHQYVAERGTSRYEVIGDLESNPEFKTMDYE